MSSLAAAWGLARRRMAADPFVVVAIALVVLLATTLLASGPLYTDAVTEAGLRRRLETAPPDEVGAEVVVRSLPDRLADLDTEVRDAVERRLGGVVAGVDRITQSDSLRSESFPDATIATVASAVDYAGLVEVVDEATEAVGGVPVSLHVQAAEEIGLAVGDQLVVDARDGTSTQLTVRSTFQPLDASDRRWWDSGLLRDGVVEGVSFTQVGPLVVDDLAALGAMLGEERVTTRWRVRLLPDAVTTASLRGVQQGVERLAVDVARLEGVSAADVGTELDVLLATTVEELTATRASVVVVALQLALLALYTLALVANLVVDTRAVETTLVRARGATPGQIALAAVLEGAVIALPSILLGPPLAALLLRGLDDVGVLADVGLVLAAQLTPTSFAGAVVAGVAAVGVLVVPARRAARTTFASARASRSRAPDRSLLQRSGADVALLAVAVAGLWQLRSAGSAVAGDVEGLRGVDPLLVVAPALGLLAGAVLVLRAVPLLGTLAIRAGSRRSGFVGTLAAWQLGRRPGPTSRALLLLVMAVAIGTFASAYSTTWSRSQADQAVAVVGSDLLVLPDTRLGTGQPAVVLGAGLADVDGVQDAVAGLGARVRVGSGGTAALVAVDLRDPTLLRRRGDVAPRAGQLHAPVDVVGVDLPGAAPSTLSFDLRATRPDREGRLAIVFTVRDADGLLHQLLADGLVTDGERGRVELPLSRRVDGRDLPVRGPLRLLGVEVLTPPVLVPGGPGVVAPPNDELAMSVELTRLAVDDVAVDLAEAEGWSTVVTSRVVGVVPPGVRDAEVTDRGVTLEVGVGAAAAAGRTGFRVSPVERGQVGVVPAAVTPGVLAATGLGRGDRFVVDVGSADVQLEIAQVVDVVPMAPDDERAVLVDLPSLAAQRYVRGGGVTVPDRWLVAAAPRSHGEVARAAAAPPFRSPQVLDVDAEAGDRRSDPVAVGLIGALTAGMMGAGLLAALGHLVTATVAVRQRTGEFALLRALGVSPGETRRWLVLESLVTVGGGIVTGLLLGVGLARVILPAVSLARDGAQAVPVPILVVPWLGIGVVAAVAGVILLVVPLVLSGVLERTRVAEVLRLGEET